MGFSLSWIAVRGKAPEAVNALLGLRSTGIRQEVAESAHNAIALPGGFYLVIFNRKELSAHFLRRISRSAPLVYGFVEEHVMYSTLAEWENGQELWAVVHDAQEGTMDLQVRGSPPHPYGSIRDRLVAEQKAESEPAEVDYIFDIPVELGKELTGFRHDERLPGVTKEEFEVLEPVKSGFFARMMSRD